MQNLRCSGVSPERNDIADFYEERDRQESFRARDEARERRERRDRLAKVGVYSDDVPHACDMCGPNQCEDCQNKDLMERNRVWSLISNKAHLYSAAYCLETGEYIKVLGVRRVGVFACVLRDGTPKDIGCEMLHDYRV